MIEIFMLIIGLFLGTLIAYYEYQIWLKDREIYNKTMEIDELKLKLERKGK